MYIETLNYIKTKSYRTTIVINGHKIISPSFKTKSDCKKWFTEQFSQKNKIQIYGNDSKFYLKKYFNSYCDDWLLTKKAQGVSKSTLQNYESNVRVHFKPFFLDKHLKSISKSDVEKLQIHLKLAHNSKGVNIIITVLKSIFREAIKEGYILKTPCEYIKSLSEEQRPDVFWSKEELEQFLRVNYQHELYDLFLIAMNTGLRKGELAGLKWNRVNFERNILGITRIRDRLELKETTKTYMIRWVPMNDVVKSTLLRLKKREYMSDYVFLSKEGQPISTHHLYRTFQRAQVKAGIKNLIRFHDLRHTFASNYVIDGRSVFDLQKFLGHTDVKMTQRYAHLSDIHLQQAMSGFNLGSARKNDDSETSLKTNVLDLRDHKKTEEPQNHPRKGSL